MEHEYAFLIALVLVLLIWNYYNREHFSFGLAKKVCGIYPAFMLVELTNMIGKNLGTVFSSKDGAVKLTILRFDAATQQAGCEGFIQLVDAASKVYTVGWNSISKNTISLITKCPWTGYSMSFSNANQINLVNDKETITLSALVSKSS